MDEGFAGCLTTNAESAGFLHNVEVLTLYPGFSLPATRFSPFRLSSFSLRVCSYSSYLFISYLPLSYSFHILIIRILLLLPPPLAIFRVLLFLSRLRKVLPHLLPLLSSSFSALTFQVSHTSSYLHFPFVLLLVLPTLPLLSPS